MTSLVACRDVPRLDATIPESVSLAAIVTLVGDEVTASTRLFPWAADSVLPIVTEASGASVIVGYSQAQLDAAGMGAVDLTALGGVRSAVGCAPSLPAPAWAGQIVQGELRSVDPATVPRLGLVGLEQVCPAFDEADAYSGFSCSVTRCETPPRRTGVCAFEIGDPLCAIGLATIAVHPDGSACVDWSTSGWRCEAARPARGAARYECAHPMRCDVDVHVRPNGAPPFDVVRLAVTEAPDHLSDRLIDGRPTFAEQHSEGYVHDFDLVGDHIVVAVPGGDAPTIDCLADTSTNDRLLIYRAADLSLVATATVPVCTRAVAGEAAGATFLIVTGRDGRIEVRRYDVGGRLLARASVDDPIGPGEPRAWRAVDLIVVGVRAYAMIANQTSNGHIGGLVELSLEPLRARTRAMVSRAPEPPAGAFPIDSTTFGTFATAAHQFWIVDTTSFAIDVVDLPSDVTNKNARFGAALHRRTNTFVHVTRGAWGLIFVDRQSRAVKVREVFAGEQFYTRVASWVAGGDLVVMGGMRNFDWAGIVSFASVPDARILPGTFVVGHGPVQRIRTDGRGRTWMSLPWGGDLVRLTPH